MDKDIRIQVAYDGAGAKEAKADMEEIQHIGEAQGKNAQMAAGQRELADGYADVAETSAEAARGMSEAAEATRESSAGASEAAERARALEAQMKLETMARRELVAELERLKEARKAAAEAGEAEKVQELTEQYKRTKSVLGELTAQQNLSKAAMMGQATAGMQFAQNLGSLAQQVKSGSRDIAGMASQVMSLGMAIKAGLGPIGLIMTAIQGVQMAFEYYNNKKLEKVNAEIQENEERMERLKKEWEELGEAGKAERSDKLDRIKEQFDARKKLAEQDRRDREEEARSAEAAAREEDERRLAAAKERYEVTLAEIAEKKALGELSAREALLKKQEAEETLRMEREGVEAQREKRELAEATSAAESARMEAEALRKAVQDEFGSPEMKKVLSISLPSADAMKALELRLRNVNDAEEEAKLLKKKAEFDKYLAVAEEAMRKMGISTEGGQEAVAEWIRKVQEVYKTEDEIAKNKEKDAEIAEKNVEEARRAYETRQQTRASEKNAADARARAERKSAEVAEAREKREREWTRVQQKSLADQKAWLARTLDSMRSGSKEWDRWAKESRKITNKAATEELRKLEDTYKTTRSYAKASEKTEAQVLASDRARLAAKMKRLRELRETPGLSADVMREINKEMTETKKEMEGIKKTMREAGYEAQKSLANFKFPDLKAATAGHRQALKNLEKYYKAEVARMERAASKGDSAAVDKLKQNLAKLALRIEACTGYTGEMTASWKQSVAAADLMLKNYRKTTHGMTAGQIASARIKHTLERGAKGLYPMGAAAGELSKNTKEAADEAKKTGKSVGKAAKAGEGAAGESKAAQREMSKAKGGAQRLSEAARRAADALDQTATEAKQQAEAAQSVGDQADMGAALAELRGSIAEQTVLINQAEQRVRECTETEAQVNQKMADLVAALGAQKESIMQTLGLVEGLANSVQTQVAEVNRKIKTLENTIKKMQKL